ncbi:MAG: hypothetical protein DRH97_03565 [Chloroflexi bacterium]|nr:MAG: hypothetical protein DRH97_03565 [Chloroflexota bacterium]
MLYIPKYFDIKELTPPEMGSIIKKHGAAWAWATLFDPRLLKTMDYLREQFGVLYANNWKQGTCYRGFRPDGCDIGATYSQHRFGRAVDLIPKELSASEIRQEILRCQNGPRYQYIGGLEMGIHWLHIDTRARLTDKILTFNP